MYYGVYREDVLQANGTYKRVQRWVRLGNASERAAWKTFQPLLDQVNESALKMPTRTGLSLAAFIEEWRSSVACNLKASTVRAMESHIRAHLLPKLGELTLTEINTKVVQGFVAHLAQGGRSLKTVQNVLLTLSSLLKTAKGWDYACGNFKFSSLTLPREEIKKEPRSFRDEEMRRMIAEASELFGTILAVTAVLGLRIGETLALRVSDVDFTEKIIRVRQSVDAATRTITTVKSKASSADLPMPSQLEMRLAA